MNRGVLTSLARLRPKVIHAVPGRLRLRLPPAGSGGTGAIDMEEFGAYFTNTRGITGISYDGRTGAAVITYEPGEITEEIILRAVKRLTRGVMKAAARAVLLPPERRTAAFETLKAYLIEHPVDVRSTDPVEVPREIWH